MVGTDSETVIRQPFFDWIIQERDRRSWNDAELASAANISHSNLSLIMSGQRNITFDFCVGIARAFRVRPEEALYKAGLLPPNIGADRLLTEEEAEVMRLWRSIKNELGRETALKVLQGLAED